MYLHKAHVLKHADAWQHLDTKRVAHLMSQAGGWSGAPTDGDISAWLVSFVYAPFSEGLRRLNQVQGDDVETQMQYCKDMMTAILANSQRFDDVNKADQDAIAVVMWVDADWLKVLSENYGKLVAAMERISRHTSTLITMM